jgi:hypothetical protein
MLAPGSPGDANAFAEQHASAFVILARILGIPARVGVGYGVDGAALAAGRTVTVRTSDAHAWGEVPVVGYGWVPLETVNPTRAKVRAPEDTSIAAPNQKGVGRVDGPGGGGQGGRAEGRLPAAARHALTGLELMLALLFLYLLLVVGEKLRRRWWRKRSDPGQQVTGAWREAEDRLAERGIPRRRDWTPHDVARQASQKLGDDAANVAALAAIVDETWFGPEPPSRGRANEAWELTRRLRRDLAVGGPWVSQPLALMDPRPLLPRRWASHGVRRVSLGRRLLSWLPSVPRST